MPKRSPVVGNIGLSAITGPFGLLLGLIGLFKIRAVYKIGVMVPRSYRMLLIAAVGISLLNLGFWWLYFIMAPPAIPPVA